MTPEVLRELRIIKWLLIHLASRSTGVKLEQDILDWAITQAENE